VQRVTSPCSSTASAELERIECHVASAPADLAAHFGLRNRIFVDEQRLFALDDRDEHDDDERTLHVVGVVDDDVCGAVRLYPRDAAAELWKGDRLAVAPERRANHLGARLVRFAVATAGRLGGRRMIAHIQLPNVPFFERLGWHPEGQPEHFVGVPHQLMSIRLGPGRET
jgi:putative N-acetyltransferase (TIGR04045 family)